MDNKKHDEQKLLIIQNSFYTTWLLNDMNSEIQRNPGQSIGTFFNSFKEKINFPTFSCGGVTSVLPGLYGVILMFAEQKRDISYDKFNSKYYDKFKFIVGNELPINEVIPHLRHSLAHSTFDINVAEQNMYFISKFRGDINMEVNIGFQDLLYFLKELVDFEVKYIHKK